MGKVNEYDPKLGIPERIETPDWIKDITQEIVKQNSMILKGLFNINWIVPKDPFTKEDKEIWLNKVFRGDSDEISR